MLAISPFTAVSSQKSRDSRLERFVTFQSVCEEKGFFVDNQPVLLGVFLAYLKQNFNELVLCCIVTCGDEI